MTKFLQWGNVEANNALSALFSDSPPVLVEVRFPRMGTSPDWYLCNDPQELVEIMNKLGVGVELNLSSVWDLQNPKGEICLKK
jgi:hypothetical protein